MIPKVDQVLALIKEHQTRNGTGNPEGETEVQTYHVWEVLNELFWQGIILATCKNCQQELRSESGEARDFTRVNESFCPHAIDFKHRPEF